MLGLSPCSLRSSASNLPTFTLSTDKDNNDTQQTPTTPRDSFAAVGRASASSLASKSHHVLGNSQRRDRNPTTNFLVDLRVTKKKVNKELMAFLDQVGQGDWIPSSVEFQEKFLELGREFVKKSEKQI